VASRDRGEGRGAPGLEPSDSPGERPTPAADIHGEASTRRPEDPPTRNPGRYSLTDHFRERLAQGGRYVTTEGVNVAIREGQLRWNTTDGWRFARIVDGVRLVVVVCDTETTSPVVVTAWTELADPDAARRSDRWDRTDLETIQLRTALSERADQHIPDRIRLRDVPRPFQLCGHTVSSDPGKGHLRCVDCGGRFRSKDDLDRARCSG
jgi:hypothetical protein